VVKIRLAQVVNFRLSFPIQESIIYLLRLWHTRENR